MIIHMKQEENTSPPIVMTFSANDPTGGAGIQADIEAMASMGCHCVPIITSTLVQDTSRIQDKLPNSASLVTEQARAILEELPVAAFKVGEVGHIENINAIQAILSDYPQIPIVLDPELCSGGRQPQADIELINTLRKVLCPLATLTLLNSVEAHVLAPNASNLDACAFELMDEGSEFVFISGAHAATATVINSFYGDGQVLETFSWDRLPFHYHGAGTTISAAITALFAYGLEPLSAILEAQEYTYESLKSGYRPGLGQHLPNRFFWARDEAINHEETLN